MSELKYMSNNIPMAKKDRESSAYVTEDTIDTRAEGSLTFLLMEDPKNVNFVAKFVSCHPKPSDCT
jgi:hypothetical protein